MGALILLAAPVASGQVVTVRGFVSDARSGAALEAATLAFTDDEGRLFGTATDRAGAYVIALPRPGRYRLRASYVGYESRLDTLQLEPGAARGLNVRLAPASEALGEVVVEAARAAGIASAVAGAVTIRPADVRRLPAPGPSADLATYLAAQPAVVTTGDRGGQLFIRGGEPSQNLVLLDGMTLYQPFHVIGFYSAFPADILQSATVHAGGYGARFGGRLSSVIDVAARHGDLGRARGAASASPFALAARLEGPLWPGRASFLASVRRSVVEEVAGPLVGQKLPFAFGDAFGKVYAEVSARTRLSVTGLATSDRGVLRAADPDAPGGPRPAEEVRWANRGVSAHYQMLPVRLPVHLNARLSYSRLDAELGALGAPLRTSAIANTALDLDAIFYGPRATVEAGLALHALRLDTRLGGLFQNLDLTSTALSQFSLYVEPEWALTPSLRLRAGARLQFYAVRTDPYVEPRLRLVWARGPHRLSGAAGLYHQEVVGLTDRRDAAGVFTAWANVPRVDEEAALAGRLSRAAHGLAGYRYVGGGVAVAVEAFYKRMGDLFVAEWTALPRLTTALQPATGRAFGGDVRVEAERGVLYGSLSYGLSSTRYAAEQASLALWYGTERLRFRPPHDRRHQVSAIGGARWRGFEFRARWAFGSGLPFSRPRGFDGFVLVDGLVDAFEEAGTRRVIYGRPFDGVLPTYHRLDLSVERRFRAGPAEMSLLVSVLNAYDRRNLFYLDVFTFRRVDQLPLTPSLGLRVEF